MWYCNQSNFSGLLAVAESIETETQWRPFVEYCMLRERGLRQDALAAIERLIQQSEHWSIEERRRFVNWIYETHLAFPDVHQLISSPLKQRLLVPTLAAWIADDPASATPRRWMGFATGDTAYFTDALACDPKDDISRYNLVCSHLNHVDFQCHHLPECFIGDVNHASEMLAVARELGTGFSDRRILPSLEGVFSTLNGKVRDWILFQNSGGGSFSEWCRVHGRDYKWVASFDYDKR